MTAKICEALWKKVIRARDKICQRPRCPYCFNQEGTKYLQVHHIIDRNKWAIRYHLENGILLCRSSHYKWAHINDPEIQIKINEWYKQITDMDYLNICKHNEFKNDYHAIEIYLKQKLKEYNEN